MARLVISYAREDRHLVRSIVQLLRGALSVKGAVFWDEEFTPGKEWAEQFRQEIDKSPELYVFWCSHSAASDYVSGEVAYALSRGKLVVPVLMDDTPLSDSLGRRQGIDVRGVVNHERGSLTGLGTADPVSPVTLEGNALEHGTPEETAPYRHVLDQFRRHIEGPGLRRLRPVAVVAALGALASAWLLWNGAFTSRQPPTGVYDSPHPKYQSLQHIIPRSNKTTLDFRGARLVAVGPFSADKITFQIDRPAVLSPLDPDGGYEGPDADELAQWAAQTSCTFSTRPGESARLFLVGESRFRVALTSITDAAKSGELSRFVYSFNIEEQ